MTPENEANCQHGIAMDIYCEKCEKESLVKPLRIVGIEKALGGSVLEREIWNAAIEAAKSRLIFAGAFQLGNLIGELKK